MIGLQGNRCVLGSVDTYGVHGTSEPGVAGSSPAGRARTELSLNAGSNVKSCAGGELKKKSSIAPLRDRGHHLGTFGYLDPFGTPESREEYVHSFAQWQAGWLSGSIVELH
jgi:hypothetical protein